MEFKRGNNSIYLGESEADCYAVIGYRDYKEGVKEVYTTRVKEEYSGQGIARKLVEELADLARVEGFKLYPTCSYVVKLFERDEKYEDVAYRE